VHTSKPPPIFYLLHHHASHALLLTTSLPFCRLKLVTNKNPIPISEYTWGSSTANRRLVPHRDFFEAWTSKIFRHLSHKCGKVVIRKHRAPLAPQGRSVLFISLRIYVDPRTIGWPEGLKRRKMSKIPSRIKPTTFWLVAQCLNHLRYLMYPAKSKVSLKSRLKLKNSTRTSLFS
jgi:hypothetical protein